MPGGNRRDKRNGRIPPAERPPILDDGRMSVTSTTFRLRPIDPAVADRLRADWASSRSYVADEKPGYPCRQCLNDAEIGDELLLVSYDPFTVDSPYRAASPIFLHRVSCGSPNDTATLPLQLTGRQLSVRSFDAAALMIAAAVIDGERLGETLDRFLQNVEADHVHVHNASRGCWAVRVDRAP